MPVISSDTSRTLTEKFTIAFCSGASSITISRKSPPIGAGPTRRITSSGLENSNVSKASMMAPHHITVRISTSWSMRVGISAAASRLRCVPIFSASVWAPMLLRICLVTLSGSVRSLGSDSNINAAVCAAARRSLSQLRRKSAIQGT